MDQIVPMADDTALMFGLTWIQDERKQQVGRKRSNHDVLSMRMNRLLNGVFLPRGTHSEPNIES